MTPSSEMEFPRVAFSNMWVRTAVGLTFAPFIVILAWTGGFFLFLFVTLVALIGLREYYGMAGAKTLSPNHPLGYAAVLAICLDAWRNRGTDFSIILAGLVLLTMMVDIFRKKAVSPLQNTAITVFGVLYTGWTLSHVILLRNLPDRHAVLSERDGTALVLLAFLIPWIGDTAAYFTGRAIGRRKLIPRISPAKTVEGAIGGVIGVVALLLVVRPLLFPFLTPLDCAIVGSVGAVIAQMGDLSESLIKRDAGIKDASHIIPGHGGALDRFDSVLFVAPCLYYYLTLTNPFSQVPLP